MTTAASTTRKDNTTGTGVRISDISSVIEDIRNGRMVILVDDEDRENEGDLIISAQMATPEAINFMAQHGRGLICLSLEEPRIQELGLPQMVRKNQARNKTAFTVSIEAREGITTGISAHDRARTIATAIDPSKGAQALVSPGHVFPLAARPGGVLVRAGHTEATVDLARMAGLIPAGVLCEIMNPDGTMARLPELLTFAGEHGIKVATIADLIAHRLNTETTIERRSEGEIETHHAGTFRAVVYENTLSGVEHVALIKNNIPQSTAPLVRMHGVNLLKDGLWQINPAQPNSSCSDLHQAMKMIDEHGSGVIVLIRQEANDVLSAQVEGAQSSENDQSRRSQHLRDYGIGAQILRDLNITRMRLLSNSRKIIVALDGYGLSVDDVIPLHT